MNFFYKIFCLFLFLSFFENGYSQVEPNPNGYNKFYYKNGKISSEGFMKNNMPEGVWKTYYENGNLKSEGKRTNLMLDSIWTFYNEDGTISKKIQYLDDKKHGYTESFININDTIKNVLVTKELFLDNLLNGTTYVYSNDGHIEKEIKYVDGKKHGLSKDFTKDSTIITTYEYYKGFYIKREQINRFDNNNEKHNLWKEFYPNDNIKKEAFYLHGKLNGYYREYDNKGIIIVEKKYNNGEEIMEGEQEISKIDYREKYDENDNVIFTGTYKDSLPIGIHKQFDSKGEILNAWLYNDMGVLLGEGVVDKKGRKQSNWKFYYENGDIKSKGEYKNDKETGYWEYFYQGGLIEQKGKYERGKPNGLWEWFYANEKHRRTENYYKGKEDGASVEYSENGEIISEGEYSDGEKTGLWTYNVGDHIENGNFKFGLKDGIWEHYYKTKVLKFKGLYVQGVPDGTHIYYFPNGKPLEIQYYVMGKKEGKWKRFSRNGELLIMITYKDDVEIKIDGGKIKPEHSQKIQ